MTHYYNPMAEITLQTIYFSNNNENKILNGETHVESLSLEPQ